MCPRCTVWPLSAKPAFPFSPRVVLSACMLTIMTARVSFGCLLMQASLGAGNATHPGLMLEYLHLHPQQSPDVIQRPMSTTCGACGSLKHSTEGDRGTLAPSHSQSGAPALLCGLLLLLQAQSKGLNGLGCYTGNHEPRKPFSLCK